MNTALVAGVDEHRVGGRIVETILRLAIAGQFLGHRQRFG
jgi:hypothetical protein